MKSAIHFTAMPHRDEKQLVRGDIELIDDPVIADPHAKLRSALQAHVRKAFKSRTKITNRGLDRRTMTRGKLKEDAVKLAGVDLRGLFHRTSGLEGSRLSFRKLGLASLDAGNKLRIQFRLVFQIIGKPVLQLLGLLAGQREDLMFDGFNCRHDGDGWLLATNRRIVSIFNYSAYNAA